MAVELFTPIQVMEIEQLSHILDARDEVINTPLSRVAVKTSIIEFFDKDKLQNGIDHAAFARWLDLRDQHLEDIGNSLVKERMG